MALPERVLATIRRHRMLPRGGRVVVALSGGPDSVALLEILRELEAAGMLSLAGVAHFNHQLRAAAAEDEQFCRGLAVALGLPIEVGTADVRRIAREEKRSIEDAARRLRYGFLEAAADRSGADGIAIGHSLDDQAETFLLRVIRGAGTRGLGGIRPKAGRVIRPLIEVSRAELRQYAAERGLTFREDETNADTSIPRNRVRHELLPYLEGAFSSSISRVLAREAALAQDDHDWLEQQAIELTASLVSTDELPGRVAVDAEALTSLHPAMASRVAHDALARLAAGRFIGYEDVARLLEFARTAKEGQALSLPGQRVRLTSPRPAAGGSARRRIVMEPEPLRSVEHVASPSPVRLPMEGEVRVGDWLLGIQRGTPTDGLSGAHEALVREEAGPLAVRFRRPGDKLAPAGMGGRTRKLQDYLVDRKVAREERDRLPLVVDEHDRIVWVVGHGVTEGFRASAASPGVILLKARRLGGEV